jgi:hypothetical protein
MQANHHNFLIVAIMMKAAFLLLLGAHSVASASLRHRKLERTLAANRIDEQYIVVFHESVDVKSKASTLKTQLPNCEINFTYEEETFHGVSLGKVSQHQLSDLLEDPDVVFVEEVSHRIVRLRPSTQRCGSHHCFTGPNH